MLENITILMPAHNAAAYLERSLPLVLGQDYPCFEVLVVVDSCTDHTIERLEQMEARWPSLRHIIIPSSAWHPDRYRLAISLGAKTARYDWIMVLHPEYAPGSTLWLRLMASACTGNTDRVIGFSTIETGDTERFVTAFEQWLAMPRRRIWAEENNTLCRRDVLLTPRATVNTPVRNAQTVVRRPLPYGNIWWRQQLHRIRLYNSRQDIAFRLCHALAVWQLWLAACASCALGLFVAWWAGLLLFVAWQASSGILFASFCRSVGQKPFYLSHLYNFLTLPLILHK